MRFSFTPLAVLFSALWVAREGSAQGFIQWERVGAAWADGPDGAVAALACGGAQPTVVYAATEGKQLHRSDDLGSTWVQLKGESPCLTDPGCLATAPADGRLVLAACGAAGAGLFRSADAGATWTRCEGLASPDVSSLAFAPGDGRFVLAGHRVGGAVSASADGGATWVVRNLPGAMPDQAVVVLGDSRWVVASRTKGGIYWTSDAGATWTTGKGDVDYFGGALPAMQAGDCLFTSKHHGLIKSVDGGQTWRFEMGPHTRPIGAVGTVFLREGDRTFLRGTQNRILNLELSANHGTSWSPANFGLLGAVPETLRPELIVPAGKDPYAHVRLATAWAAAPDGRTVFLGLGKAGLYRGRLMWTAKGPMLLQSAATPVAVSAGDDKTRVALRAVATTRTGRIAKVTADLGALGQGEIELLDDGAHDDGEAGDKTYGNTFTVGRSVPAGEKSIGIVAADDAGGISSGQALLTVASEEARMTVWDGDAFSHGQAWMQPQSPLVFLKAQTDEAHAGKVALELRGEGGGFIGGGWNWHGWYPEGSGADITAFANLSFWVKLLGDDPGSLSVTLVASRTKKQAGMASVADYLGDGVTLADGQWHEVVIPLKDLYAGAKERFDASRVWELDINTWAPKPRVFSLFIDDIGFDNRRVRSRHELVTAPVERAPKPLTAAPAAVGVEVDLAAAGTAISPWIYGAAMGDRKLAAEAGVTALRAGGNPVSPMNWKRGFGAKGSDWFFQNEGSETPPENNWLLTFHRENRLQGLETYLTLPTMGRVAKDATSVAFDIKKYADQDSWAGQSQPSDRLPHAGSGRRFARGADGQFLKDAKGNRVIEPIAPDPDDTSVAMSPDEQCEMLSFMIDRMKYGTADRGGVKYIALDNEPCLWHATHRGMHPAGTSYDELWQRTVDYADRLKKIDPTVQIAGPTWFGWTAYFASGRDMELCGAGKASWSEPPDRKAHGDEPITVWWLKQLAAYEKQHGVRLVDILDFHFYPQTGIYMGGTPNDPNVMEGRVQETRVLWDPQFVDPSWMAGDENGKAMGGKLRLLRLMKEWIDAHNPGMQRAIGEYNWGGEKDVSGGVTQVELLGIFAREQIDHAYFWFFPGANSPHYFAFKLLRNPDGAHTAVGDRYVESKVSAPDDVSVHTYRDTKTGRVSFVLVNKRAAKDAKVTLKLLKAIPEQDATVYEYSAADRFAIGRLPARKVGGRAIEVELPSLSAVRLDVKP